MNPNRTYRPPLPQIPADPLCGNPCDSHDPRRCVPPLKGLRNPRAASVSYRASVPAGHGGCEGALSCRASSPDGESLPFGIEGGTPVSPTPQITNHYSLITTHWTFTFSAKERDSETGLSYFGSRYYSSDMSIWLSVDPMSDKYPSLSPYVYCANNPVKLVDPNGEEVEYNSFADIIIVGVLKIFDNGFRKQFNELKKSGETYVFNWNKDGDNSFTTDGNKLFINYSMADNGKSKKAGQTIFSNLRHETTHGIQFEYGEIGFSVRGVGYGIVDRDGNYFESKGWQPVAYDLTDEYEAHNNQNFGFRWNGNKNDVRSQWINCNREERMQGLKNIPNYSELDEEPINCSDKKIKTNNYYALPNRKRP